LQKQQTYTGQDLDIGSIKDPSPQASYAEIQKVDHGAMIEYTVDQIAEAASDDKGERDHLDRMQVARRGDEQQ